MVYIQSDNDRKLPHHFDAACALYGAMEHGLDFRLTTYDEVLSGKFDRLIRGNLFVGSVEFMTLVFSRIDKKISALKNVFQEFELATLEIARQKVESGGRLFIKPIEIKQFTGMVFDAQTINQLGSYASTAQVIIAKPYQHRLISETRCYIHHNKIVDARNYAGDFKVSPDYTWAESVLSKLSDFPVAFTMDIGVLENCENVVVEFNDMWAIGNYGIENALYFKLLRGRYFEITNTE